MGYMVSVNVGTLEEDSNEIELSQTEMKQLEKE